MPPAGVEVETEVPIWNCVPFPFLHFLLFHFFLFLLVFPSFPFLCLLFFGIPPQMHVELGKVYDLPQAGPEPCRQTTFGKF